FLNDDSVVGQPQRYLLQRDYRRLGRFDDAVAITLREDGPLKQLQRLQFAVEAGRTADLLPLFRAFHVNNRWERRSFTPFLLPAGGVGGMDEYLARRDEAAASRINLYRLMAKLPCAPAELRALFAAAPAGASEVSTL